jgi:aminoglycoside phosphotransferase (APT) family kinase protein
MNNMNEPEEVNIALLQEAALDVAKTIVTGWHQANEVSSIEFLAVGGYNRVWLITYEAIKSEAQAKGGSKFVLRIPRTDTPSLKPYQVRHEVGCLRFLEKNLPSIPAPRIYAWNDGLSGVTPFIAEEFMDGRRLSVLWPQLTEKQKTTIIEEIANIVADLGETRFQAIGGFTHDSHAGPTIEAAKVFNGRAC